MSTSKPVVTPIATSVELILSFSDLFSDPHRYRSIVGSLQYLSHTRSDISFAVNHICLYMHQPKLCHWKVIKFYDISMQFMNFPYAYPLLCNQLLLPSPVPIGQETLMITASLVHIVYVWGLTLFLGHERRTYSCQIIHRG